MTESTIPEKEWELPKGNGNVKISKERIDKICQEITRGVPLEYACKIAGVTRDAFYKWVKKGEELDDDSDCIYKYAQLKKEESVALAVASRIERIRIDPSWQSDAWWLERMANEHFGRRQTIDANVDAKVKSEDISKLFDDAKVTKILEEEKKE